MSVVLLSAAAQLKSDIYLYGKVRVQISKILEGIWEGKKVLRTLSFWRLSSTWPSPPPSLLLQKVVLMLCQ